MPKPIRFLLLVPAILLLCQASHPAQEKRPTEVRLRRPVAMTLADDGRTLLVANRDSGTLAILDTQQLRVTAESRFARKLSDMVANRDRTVLAVTDEAAGELVLVRHGQGALREVRRLRVGHTPVSVQL